MKILVTGGAGFIGSHIVDELIKKNHKVVVMDNLSTGRKEFINQKAKFYKMDIRSKDVEKVFAKEKFDIVNHHAAQKDLRLSVKDPVFDADINILGSLNLLQSCVKYGVKKFIFASSGGAVYGDVKNFPVAEDYQPLQPVSPYGIAKLSIENYLFYFKKEFNLDYVALRYSNVYGPRQDPYGEAGVIAIFMKKLLANEQPVINGDGKQTRDYVYVSDVVKTNISAINKRVSGAFNIGTGIETSVNKLYALIAQTVGANKKAVHGPAKPGEQRRSSVDFKKAQKILAWRPAYDLNEGLKETYQWFLTNIKSI